MKPAVKKTVKIAAYVGLGYAVLRLVQGFTALKSVAEDITVSPGLPRVHKVDTSGMTVVLDNVQITNQSPLSLTLENMYNTVQYWNGSIWATLLLQHEPVARVDIKANTTFKIPSTTLYMSATDLPSIAQIFREKRPLKIITKFQVKGFTLSVETTISTAEFITPLFNGIGNILTLIS